jgi:hypothetical protein
VLFGEPSGDLVEGLGSEATELSKLRSHRCRQLETMWEKLASLGRHLTRWRRKAEEKMDLALPVGQSRGREVWGR